MKNFKKKLQFSSKSITELNNNKMKNIQGGSTTFFVDWVQGQIDEAMEEMSPWI